MSRFELNSEYKFGRNKYKVIIVDDKGAVLENIETSGRMWSDHSRIEGFTLVQKTLKRYVHWCKIRKGSKDVFCLIDTHPWNAAAYEGYILIKTDISELVLEDV